VKLLTGQVISLAFSATLFAFCFSAGAQQPVKIPRIEWLTAGALAASPERISAFREGLRELGYVEGKNIIVEWRSPDGKLDRMATIAAEIVALKPDIIVTGGSGATRPVRKATSTIPIVMAQDSDPIGNGYVASLARPGGNVTGLSRLAPELSGKQVELLREVVPGLTRLAVLVNSTPRANVLAMKEIESAAAALKIRVQYLDVVGPSDFETVFHDAAKQHADAALWLIGGNIASIHRKSIADFAIKSRLPVVYEQRAAVEAGGLRSYGVNFSDLDRRAAVYVDKILKGAKPADLPVEQPTKFELVINLKTAKQIGVTIPSNVLARADRVIR